MSLAKRRIAYRVGFEKCPIPWKELKRVKLFSYICIAKSTELYRLFGHLLLHQTKIRTENIEIERSINPWIFCICYILMLHKQESVLFN